jgi:hypothetical protein
MHVVASSATATSQQQAGPSPWIEPARAASIAARKI